MQKVNQFKAELWQVELTDDEAQILMGGAIKTEDEGLPKKRQNPYAPYGNPDDEGTVANAGL